MEEHESPACGILQRHLLRYLPFNVHVFEVIYQALETVFHRDIQTSRRKCNAQRSNFDEIRGVWIANETLSRVLDIFSQSKQKLKSRRRSKIVKIYAN